MKLVLLDKFTEGAATCFLCRTSLAEYIGNLPAEFRDFYIQRGIVSNKFLDNLWETVSTEKHIPPIVLVSPGKAPEYGIGDKFELDDSIKVLDGLQRSHRLKEIWDAIAFIEKFDDTTEITPARLARVHAEELAKNNINSKVFQKIISSKRLKQNITKLFENNKIWLEIWFNLTETQQIRKMLILNAGHKSVNIKHQIELIFWSNFGTLLEAMQGAKIVREREKSSSSYSKEREAGEYHFAHLVSAFVSLTEGKPITTNADYSASKSFDNPDSVDDQLYDVDKELLVAFAKTLSLMDSKNHTPRGIKWLGREVVLVGIFGAIGAFAAENNTPLIDVLTLFDERISEFVSILNLEEFEAARNRVDLSKVNIGNVNKRAVFKATHDFLTKKSLSVVDWKKLFELTA